MQLIEWLQGKKTFLMAACLIIVTICYAFHLIDEHAFMVLSGLFGSGGLMALRNGQTMEVDRAVVAAQVATEKIMESSTDDADKVVEAIVEHVGEVE